MLELVKFHLYYLLEQNIKDFIGNLIITYNFCHVSTD